MRTAVIGAMGQLGRDLVPLLPGEVLPLERGDLDLNNHAQVRQHLTALKPDHIINCAAYNLVDKAETDVKTAMEANAWGVRNLAQVCRDIDAELMQISTDYVFGLDQARSTPLAENDPTGPVGVYGLSKLAGEVFVRSICPRHYIVRTCGLFGVWGTGGKGGNFVETMLKLAQQGKQLRVVSDQYCTPSSTADVAGRLVEILKHRKHGVYHVTNSGSCSWYEFAKEIFRQSNVTADLIPVTASEYNAAAKRPSYSVLENHVTRELGLPPLQEWNKALAEYLQQRNPTRERG